jgi:hypothetical protein
MVDLNVSEFLTKIEETFEKFKVFYNKVKKGI